MWWGCEWEKDGLENVKDKCNGKDDGKQDGWKKSKTSIMGVSRKKYELEQ